MGSRSVGSDETVLCALKSREGGLEFQQEELTRLCNVGWTQEVKANSGQGVPLGLGGECCY